MRQLVLPGLQRRALLGPMLAGFATACARGGAGVVVPSSVHPHLRQVAPSFERRDLSGHAIASSSMAGRPWIVDFFAAYCAPCHERFAALQAEASETMIVGVSVDEDVASALAQVHRFALTFPVIHDPGRMLSGKFRVTTLPMTFVVDARNCVAWVADAQVAREHFSAGLRQSIATARGKRA